jgi:putative heme-binding domain-containing protein
VRYQAAFTLGEADTADALKGLARIAHRDAGDPWVQTAVLSSLGKTAPALLETLAGDLEFTLNPSVARLRFLTRLAALAASRPGEAGLARLLKLLAPRGKHKPAAWKGAVLAGLGEGLQSGQRSLARLWDKPPAALKDAVTGVLAIFRDAAISARDDKLPLADRTTATRLLGYAPFKTAAPVLRGLLAPDHPAPVQLAAVRALSLHREPKVADLLLASWGSYSPGMRREVLEALFARPERLAVLLSALEKKTILAGQLEPFRLVQLRKHPGPQIRQRALKLLAGQAAPDRRKVVASYRSALKLKGKIARGKAVFKKNCATCHRLEKVGVEVGPDLLSALKNKTPETLLVDILDPSREVDPRFINYLVTTKAGRSFSGMIAAETATSITLRRAEKAEDTLLRRQIDTIQATAKSLMPEGLEKQLSKQDVADVIAYLKSVASLK